MIERWSVPVLLVSVGGLGTSGARPSLTHMAPLGTVTWSTSGKSAQTAALALRSASLLAPCHSTTCDDVIRVFVLHLPWRRPLMEAKLLIPNLTPRWLCHVTRVLFDSTASLAHVFLLTRAKKWICGASRRKRLSGMRRGVSLPRSIGESNPVLMFHSSLCRFYVFTFYFKCLFIWHRQRALKNADKQRLGSIFICTWSQGDESDKKKKKIPRNLMQNQSPTLCLSPTSCSVVNAASLMVAWLQFRNKSAALTFISFLF